MGNATGQDAEGRTVGVGVIGTGFGAIVVAPAFAGVPGVVVRGICSANRGRAEAAAQQLGVEFATDDPAALFARPDVDLVCVVSPPHRHCELVIGAAEAGKHVFCEKPFGMGADEARAMLDAAGRNQRLHFLDFEFRTVPARRALADLIRAGELGEVRHVVITGMVPGRRFPVINRAGWWQESANGGGWLGAMGSHYIDALRDWLGEIREVSGSLETRRPALDDPEAPPITADDGFVAHLRTDSGASCSIITASTVHTAIGARIEVYGSLGTAVLDGEERLAVARGDGGLEPVELADRRDAGEPAGHPSRRPLDAWARLIAGAIRTGRQVAPSFEDGVRCQEVLAAIRASNAAGGAWTPVARE